MSTEKKIKIPNPANPSETLELTEPESLEHCARVYASMSKRPDGGNRSMRLHADDAIRMFQEGAPDRERKAKMDPQEPSLYPDELAR